MPPYVFAVSMGDSAMSIADMGIPLVYPMIPPLVGNIRGAGAPNHLSGAYHVFVHGNYAYVTTNLERTLTIIDISDLTNPVTVGFLVFAAVPGGIFVGNGSIFNGYAYVTVTDSTLRIIDISDPTNPAIVGTIGGAGAPPGGNWLSSPRGLQVVGDLVYVTANTDDALTIINVATPASPTFVGSIQGAGGPNFLNGARAVKVRGDYAYVAAFHENALTIINVATPAAPVFSGSVQGAAAPPWLGGAQALDLLGNYAIVGALGDDAITVIDVTNPAAPAYFSSIHNGAGVNAFDGPRNIKIDYPLAYVAASSDTGTGNRMSIIDIRNPAVLVYLGSLSGPGAPNYMSGCRDVALITTYLPQVQTDPATEIT